MAFSRSPENTFSILLLVLTALSTVQARWPTKKDICTYGCWDWTDHITWKLPASIADSVDYYEILCTPSVKLDSIFYCTQVYCSEAEVESGWKLLDYTCMENFGKSLPSSDEMRISKSQLANVEVVTEEAETTTAEDPADEPIVPVKEWLDLSVRTDHAFYGNIWVSYDLSYASLAYWALVILAGMLYRAVELYGSKDKQPRPDRTQSLPMTSRTWLWIRRRLLLPATFGKHCQAPIAGGTIPPRLESLVLVVYLLFNFAACFPSYDLFAGNQYWPAKGEQLSRYVADRTGHLSLANVPIMWLFAARNNPFIWLTGWSFASFNRFHRWTARLSFVHAFIHSAGYSINAVQGGYYKAEWPYQYWYAGVMATIVMSFILAGSAYWLREKHYDLFLVLHIIMAIIFFVSLWDHVRVYDTIYLPWLWPCVAVWVWDRAIRYGRMIYVSILPRIKKGTKAIVTYDTSSEMLRLDVTKFFQGKPAEPGLFYYVYTPGSLRGYESHPFTVCSWASADPDSDLDSPRPDSDELKKEELRVKNTSISSASLTNNINHSFLIRPYGGYTQRLRNGVASKSSLESGQIGEQREETVFLEGPYGVKLDLSHYSNVLVVAGGSGITAAISHAYHLLSIGKTSIQISWAVPQRHLVDDICRNELAAVMRHPRLSMDIHITSGPDRKSDHAVDEPFTITYGRPDVYDIMQGARDKCERNLAIVTCGTPAMADACRAAVVRLLKEPGPEIGYYNESMMW